MSYHTRPYAIGAKSVYEVCMRLNLKEPYCNRVSVKCTYCCSIIYASEIVDLTTFSENCETIVKQIKISKSLYIPNDFDTKDSYIL